MSPISSPLATDEQISGRAADAVADMHGELERRFTGLNLAEVQLAEALLHAHATSVLGRQRLQDIQRQLIAAINNPLNALDTPAGQRQFLMFLRSKIVEIQQILADGSLSAEDQAELTRALASNYLTGDPESAAIPAAATPAPSAGLASAVPAAMGAIPQAAGGLGQQAGAGGSGAAGSPLGALPGGLSSLLAGDPAPDPAERPEDPDDEHDDDRDMKSKDEPEPGGPDGSRDDPDGAPPEDDGPAATRPAGG